MCESPTNATYHLIIRRSDLEANLLKFYNDVMELMQSPQQQQAVPRTSHHPPGLASAIPSSVLVTFCLIFGCNLVHTAAPPGLLRPPLNKQLRHIMRQVREIDEHFGRFAERIKIIYFLLIMYMSLGGAGGLGAAQVRDDYSFYSSYFSDETNDVQRTLLDLLNSELDFQNNNVASMRVALLLKIDQFVV